MASPIPVDTLSVRLNFLGPESATASCTLYFQPVTGVPDPTKMNLLADTFMAKYKVKITPVLPNVCFLSNVYVLWNGTTEQYEGNSTDSSAQGSHDSAFMGEEIALVLQRRTNLRGRNYHGRIFMPFVPEDFVEYSKVLPFAITLYKELCAVLTTATTYDGKTYNPKHWDRKDGVMVGIQQWRVVGEIMSQKARRNPKKPIVYT